MERGPDNSETRRTIVFAEPGAVGRANVTGLLPGDRLLQVNGISVENKIRDEIIELIKASPDCVTLVVSTWSFFLLSFLSPHLLSTFLLFFTH